MLRKLVLVVAWLTAGVACLGEMVALFAAIVGPATGLAMSAVNSALNWCAVLAAVMLVSIILVHALDNPEG